MDENKKLCKIKLNVAYLRYIVHDHCQKLRNEIRSSYYIRFFAS